LRSAHLASGVIWDDNLTDINQPKKYFNATEEVLYVVSWNKAAFVIFIAWNFAFQKESKGI
jgi:hypothetical protein